MKSAMKLFEGGDLNTRAAEETSINSSVSQRNCSLSQQANTPER